MLEITLHLQKMRYIIRDSLCNLKIIFPLSYSIEITNTSILQPRRNHTVFNVIIILQMLKPRRFQISKDLLLFFDSIFFHREGGIAHCEA